MQCWKLRTEMTENESERKFWELTVCLRQKNNLSKFLKNSVLLGTQEFQKFSLLPAKKLDFNHQLNLTEKCQ
jgi:hypothetical protein